jgi:WD40 repeat protein
MGGDGVGLWRLAAPEEPLFLRGHTVSLYDAAFSADSRFVVTASPDKTARVWRADGTGQAVVLRHGAGVSSAVFSPDSRRLLTADDDGVARIWKTDWKELFRQIRSSVTSCLTTEDRRNFLGESAAAAKSAWEACEAGFGRRAGR